MRAERQLRRKFDRAFKLEAVRLSNEPGCNVATLARRLGLRPKLLYRWRELAKADGGEAFPGEGHLKPSDEQWRRLQGELAGVSEERDILKKALRIFSEERQ